MKKEKQKTSLFFPVGEIRCNAYILGKSKAIKMRKCKKYDEHMQTHTRTENKRIKNRA